MRTLRVCSRPNQVAVSDLIEIRGDVDTPELASFFTMALVGIATMAKGQAEPDQIHAATRVALSVLDAAG